MLPQLTVYAKNIYLLMVVISGALCAVEDYVIMSQCAHNKAIHLAAEGTVSVTSDISKTQNITILGLPDFVNNAFKIALYAKETQRYLCFSKNWRLVALKELQNSCYFNETIVHGYFVFRSVVDVQRRIGFTHRGKAIGPKKNVNDACYLFTKIQSDEFFHQHKSTLLSTTATTALLSTQSQSMQRIKIKRRNQKLQLQLQQQLNGHINNISLDLSNNNQEQNQQTQILKSHKKEELQNYHTHHHKHHQVRHHHNNPDIIARRNNHDQKKKSKPHQQMRALIETTARPLNSSVIFTETMSSTEENSHTTTQTAFKIPSILKTSQRSVSQNDYTTIKTVTTPKVVSDTASTSLTKLLQGPPHSTTAVWSTAMVNKKRKGHRRKHKKQNHKNNKSHNVGSIFTTEVKDNEYLMSSVSSAAWNDLTTSMASFLDSSPTEYYLSDWQSSSASDSLQYDLEISSTSAPQLISTDTKEDSFSEFSTVESTNSINSSEVFIQKNSATPSEMSFSEERSPSAFNNDVPTTIRNDNTFLAPTMALPDISNYSLSTFQPEENSKKDVVRTPKNFLTNARSVQKLTNTTTQSNRNIENVTTDSTQLDNLKVNPNLISNTIIDVNFTKWIINYKSNNTNSSNNIYKDTVDNNASINPLRELIYSTTISNVLFKNLNKTTTTKTFKNRNRTFSVRRTSSPRSASGASTETLLPLLSTTPNTFTKSTDIALLTIDKNFNHGNINNSLFIEKNSPMTTTTVSLGLNTPTTIKNTQLKSTPEISTQQTPSSSSTFSTTLLTTRKAARKSTQKLFATPFHQLTTYVRNEAGDIDIDNIDNISVYPELADDGSWDDYAVNSKQTQKQQHENTNIFKKNSNNSRLIVVSGYLPTSPSATLPTSLQIAKHKILNEREHRRSLRRFVGSSVVA